MEEKQNMTEGLVDYLCRLCRISLTPEECGEMKVKLAEIVDYMDCLRTLPPLEDGEEEAPCPAALRADVVEPSTPAEELLRGVPGGAEHTILVPRTMEGGGA